MTSIFYLVTDPLASIPMMRWIKFHRMEVSFKKWRLEGLTANKKHAVGENLRYESQHSWTKEIQPWDPKQLWPLIKQLSKHIDWKTEGTFNQDQQKIQDQLTQIDLWSCGGCGSRNLGSEILLTRLGGSHARPSNAFKEALNLRCTPCKRMTPKTVPRVLDQLNKSDQKSPWMRTIDNQAL